jgi:hypothetical protein
MTRIGTCHYRSESEAKAAHRDHFEIKVQEGGIKIGKPNFDPKVYKLLVDLEGRYWLQALKG